MNDATQRREAMEMAKTRVPGGRTPAPGAILLGMAVLLGCMMPLQNEAMAYSDKVKAPGLDGKYYPGLENYLPDKGSPEGIFERSCANIHSSGNVLLHMANAGYVGDFFGRFCARPSAEWPPGSNNEYLFMAGLWVGALDAERQENGNRATDVRSHGWDEHRDERAKKSKRCGNCYRHPDHGQR